MFTGLVQQIGEIKDIKASDGGLELAIAIDGANNLDIGASVCCSGCCLSITKTQNGLAYFAVSNETLSKTTISNWKKSGFVNIETSLKMGDELGGHFVFGHVDGLASLSDIKQDGDSTRLKITPPKDLMKFIASKGSISLDGISLTVNEVDAVSFGVNIIPHTWGHTTLRYRKVGDTLNIEIDMLARYVERMIGHRA